MRAWLEHLRRPAGEKITTVFELIGLLAAWRLRASGRATLPPMKSQCASSVAASF
jgi:hypothetical protein